MSIKKYRFGVDNAIPLIGLFFTVLLNVGAIFWWGATITANQNQLLVKQEEMISMWNKIEGRLGTDEINLGKLFAVHPELQQVR